MPNKYDTILGEYRQADIDPELFSVSSHYTGFPERKDTTLSWDNVSYTLTLAADSSPIWINGVLYSISNLTKQLSVAQEAVTGLYWFWIELSGTTPTLVCGTTGQTFGSCLVATVYWNTATNRGILSDERHWMGRDKWMHEYLHETVGARYAFGMAGTFTDTTFSIGAGEFYDEDLEHEWDADETTCKALYHNGTDAWTWDETTTPYFAVAGVLQYNNGVTLTPVDNNKYVNEWVFATADVAHPIHIVIGTAQYNTIALARAAAVPSLGGLASAETKLIYKVTYQNNGGTPDYIEATDFRTSSTLPTSGYVATDHGTLSGLGDNDHPQYALLTGASFSGDVNVTGDVVASTGFYIGDETTDGSWRLVPSGTSLKVQRLESATWKDKGEFTA